MERQPTAWEVQLPVIDAVLDGSDRECQAWPELLAPVRVEQGQVEARLS